MSRHQPPREFVPPVARYRLRYTKTGRARFASHRDFQRSFERALRRARVATAFSAGFSPHPKVSYANAAPTGAASVAEYLELGVMVPVPLDLLATALSQSLPEGLDVAEAVAATTPDFAARLEASHWRIEMPGVTVAEGERAVRALLDCDELVVERHTRKGVRQVDVRAGIAEATCTDGAGECAILAVVVRHGTPSVRPDDVVTGLARVADFAPPSPPVMMRMAQGPLLDGNRIGDPLAPDRAGGAEAV